jgi:dihydroorotate dehydrogenase
MGSHFIYPFNLEELEIMLIDLNKAAESQRLVEVNLSCPNVDRSHCLNSYSQYFDKITQLNCSNLIVGIKLAPLFEFKHYEIISHMLLKSQIQFITCCNSLLGV